MHQLFYDLRSLVKVEAPRPKPAETRAPLQQHAEAWRPPSLMEVGEAVERGVNFILQVPRESLLKDLTQPGQDEPRSLADMLLGLRRLAASPLLHDDTRTASAAGASFASARNADPRTPSSSSRSRRATASACVFKSSGRSLPMAFSAALRTAALACSSRLATAPE